MLVVSRQHDAHRTTTRLEDLNDPVLRPLIEAPDDRSREEAIEALVTNVVKPVITTVLKRARRLEPHFQIEDLEEISATTALRFIRKLRATVVSPEHAIENVESYVATLGYNALYDVRRRRYPERHRLKRNLRYLLMRERSLALWDGPECAVAGLSGWEGQEPVPLTGFLTRFTATAEMRDKTHPLRALEAILGRIGRPVAFEALIDVVAEFWDVRDVNIETDDFPPDERRDPLTSIQQREYLENLWREIRELPDNQRAALLLNLRDASGANALTLFLLLNIAGVAELARAAGLTEEAFHARWDELPLDDLKIADLLKLTRQQVINLRKSARLRLARRMARWK